VSGSPKLAWHDLPPGLRERIEQELGGRVVEALVQPTGFTPGAPLRVRTDDGGRAFVKAATAEINADSVADYRREAHVAQRLPALPEVPALRSWFDHPPWVVLVFDDAGGAPPAVPWDRAELERVLAALDRLCERLTPSPVDVPSVTTELAGAFDGWTRLAGDRRRLDLVDHDGWLSAHLDELGRLATGWVEAAAGDTLLHADVRSDQLLLDSERVYLVDWAHACTGAAFVDPFLFFPSVVLEGGPGFDELLAMSPRTRGAGEDDLVALAAAAASYFIERSTLPAPPGLPTVRDFQHRQGTVLLDWLRGRL
jgi:hypothetical protein